MKIAALVFVTLYILYWVLNVVSSVPNDPCWGRGGQHSDRVAISLLVVLPAAVSLCALVYLWSVL